MYKTKSPNQTTRAKRCVISFLLRKNRCDQLRLNFFLNLSTRPPASTNFCLPVKKGWHFEQISTRSSSFVDLVTKVSPQAHLTVTSLYSGWRFSFMSFPPLSYIDKICCSKKETAFIQRFILYHSKSNNASVFLNYFSKKEYLLN